MTHTNNAAQRREQARVMRELVDIWEHTSNIYDYSGLINRAIVAWESKNEMLEIIYEFMRMNFSGEYVNRAVEILKAAGYNPNYKSDL